MSWQKQCFTLAQRLQDPALLQEAHLMLGSTLFYLGELASGSGALGARDCPL